MKRPGTKVSFSGEKGDYAIAGRVRVHGSSGWSAAIRALSFQPMTSEVNSGPHKAELAGKIVVQPSRPHSRVPRGVD